MTAESDDPDTWCGPAPRWPLEILGACLVVSGTFASPALAHGSESGVHGVVLPVTVFLTGVVFLGASVILDARGVVDRRVADGGLLVGALCVIVSVVIFWI